MKKALRKLLPTIIMVLIAASMVGTSTFAWFSMNSTVTVTGMSVTTKVDDNLSIAATNDTVNDAQYKSSLGQTREGKLRPVSTINGINYYYTNPTNVQGNGDAIADTYIAYNEDTVWQNDTSENAPHAAAAKANYDDDFQANYGINIAGTYAQKTNLAIYGYIDYEFYIKATNVSGGAQYLNMTTCNIMYNGAAIGADKAWRVAVFAHEATKGSNYTNAWATGDLKTILAPAYADYYTTPMTFNVKNDTVPTGSGSPYDYEIDGVHIYAAESTPGTVTDWYADAEFTKKITPYVTVSGSSNSKTTATYNAVKNGTSLDIVSNYSSAATVSDSIASGSTVYTKVLVRLWLEGEDTTCTNETYVALTAAYSLDLGFNLGSANDGSGTNPSVTTIGSAPEVNASATAAAVGTVTLTGSTTGNLSNGKTPYSYQWYKADGTIIDGSINPSAITYQFTATEDGSYYCIIVGTDKSVSRTKVVTLSVS
ncbi:MAG: hypothetical protein J6126_01555 [Clostridia bacterium]|nr:hypothetical protein [Clostridia bacterium]